MRKSIRHIQSGYFTHTLWFSMHNKHALYAAYISIIYTVYIQHHRRARARHSACVALYQTHIFRPSPSRLTLDTRSVFFIIRSIHFILSQLTNYHRRLLKQFFSSHSVSSTWQWQWSNLILRKSKYRRTLLCRVLFSVRRGIRWLTFQNCARWRVCVQHISKSARNFDVEVWIFAIVYCNLMTTICTLTSHLYRSYTESGLWIEMCVLKNA